MTCRSRARVASRTTTTVKFMTSNNNQKSNNSGHLPKRWHNSTLLWYHVIGCFFFLCICLQSERLEKSGFLTKLGSRVKNWHRRWFVLKNGELVYYKSPVSAYKIPSPHCHDVTFTLYSCVSVCSKTCVANLRASSHLMDCRSFPRLKTRQRSKWVTTSLPVWRHSCFCLCVGMKLMWNLFQLSTIKRSYFLCAPTLKECDSWMKGKEKC